MNKSGIEKPRALLVPGVAEDTDRYFVLSSVRPMIEWVKCHFEVTELSPDEDFPRRMDEVQPEILIFLAAKGALRWRGDLAQFRRGRGDVPAVMVTLMDAHSPAKAALLRQVEQLGAEAVFTIDTGFRELAGDYRDLIYYAPWCLNASMCHDYGLEKTIPVALMGDGFVPQFPGDARYPWRLRNGELFLRALPCFVSPRPMGAAEHGIMGEEYGRMLNRSRLALACGAARQIATKKLLEIPASRTCLVTEPSPMVEAMGFADMENCVMGDGRELLEKCRYLLEHEEQLQAITDAGWAFVRENHGPERRRVLIDWHRLRKERRPGQAIAQPSLRGPLALVDSHSACENSVHLSQKSPFMTEYCAALEKIAALEVEEALAKLQLAGRHFPACLEVAAWSALCLLAAGKPGEALRALNTYFDLGGGADLREPDPVLWSILGMTLYCQGNREAAAAVLRAAERWEHPWLDACRKVCPVFEWKDGTLEVKELASSLTLPGDPLTVPVSLFRKALEASGGQPEDKVVPVKPPLLQKEKEEGPIRRFGWLKVFGRRS